MGRRLAAIAMRSKSAIPPPAGVIDKLQGWPSSDAIPADRPLTCSAETTERTDPEKICPHSKAIHLHTERADG